MDYFEVLNGQYSDDVVHEAVEIAKNAALLHREGYYTSKDFQPRLWVVAGICMGMVAGVPK